MIGFFKYLKGYVRIKVWGFSPERFMNLCGNRDILLWNIVKDGDVYYMYISLQSFYKLRPIARKTGTRVVILRRYGLPFLMPLLFRRKVFILGLLLSVTFWLGSSLFIWDIKVSGNYQITEDSFMTFLEEYEVRTGMKKSDLNIEEMEKEIRKTFPQITWTSAKLSGTRLLIEIKENDAPIITTANEQEEGADLVSEYDGIIVSMIVRKGVPVVAVGDQIAQNDILVEGSVPIFNEDATVREYQYVKADADIVMEHTRQFRAAIPFSYVSKEYTGRTEKKHYLRIGEKEIGIPKNSPFLVYDSVIRESRHMLLEKLNIPIFWGSCTHREYQNTEHLYTQEQAGELLNEKINVFLSSLNEKGVQIIEKNVKIVTKGKTWVLQGEFLVHEPIGIESPIMEQKQDTGEDVTDE